VTVGAILRAVPVTGTQDLSSAFSLIKLPDEHAGTTSILLHRANHISASSWEETWLINLSTRFANTHVVKRPVVAIIGPGAPKHRREPNLTPSGTNHLLLNPAATPEGCPPNPHVGLPGPDPLHDPKTNPEQVPLSLYTRNGSGLDQTLGQEK
jgi:hypothetical protein